MKTIKILISLIPPKENLKTLIFLFFTVITSLLEAVSIALIFPVIIFLLGSQNTSLYDFKFFSLINLNLESENVVFILLLALIFVFLIKSFFLIYFQWWKNSFANSLQLNISKKILKNYLYMPYLESININSAIKLRNIMTEVPKIRKSFISLMTIFVEISILAILILIIFYLQPYSALVAGIFFLLIFFLYNYFFKNTLNKWGKERLKYSGKVIKNLKDSFSGTNEIKTFYKENFFLNKYYLNEQQLLKYIKFFATFNISPKIILEFFAVLLIVVSIFVMINLNYNNADILAIIVVLGAAGIRILPTSGSLIASFNELKNNKPSIYTIAELLKEKIIIDNFEYEFTKLKQKIEIKNLDFSYNEKLLLKNVNLKIEKNNFIGIDGPSGSGKTTLINLILGLITPSSGYIFYDENDINKNKMYYRIGYVPQKSFLLDDTIKNNITFGDDKFDKVFFDKVVKVCCLEDFINKSSEKSDTLIGENALQISGGQRQRISIARALLLNPDIIVLDESFNEIDESTTLKIIDNIIIFFKNKIIFLVSHNKKILSKSDYILKLENKEIIRKNNE